MPTNLITAAVKSWGTRLTGRETPARKKVHPQSQHTAGSHVPYAASNRSTKAQTNTFVHGSGKEVQGGRGWLLPLHLGVGAWWTQKPWSVECSHQHLVKACCNAYLGNATCSFCVKTQVGQKELSTSGVKPLPKLACSIVGMRKCFP